MRIIKGRTKTSIVHLLLVDQAGTFTLVCNMKAAPSFCACKGCTEGGITCKNCIKAKKKPLLELAGTLL